MGKEIRKITLIFENCEHMDFDIDEIDYILMKKVSSEYTTGFRWQENDLKKINLYLCKIFSMYITNEANKDYIPDWSDKVESKKFDRILQYNDICAIEFEYFDKSKDEFCLVWNYKASDETNTYQKTKLLENGLLIKVKKRKDKKNNE